MPKTGAFKKFLKNKEDKKLKQPFYGEAYSG
jgi:hypothetical protein